MMIPVPGGTRDAPSIRIPPVAANLLPGEIVEERRFRRARLTSIGAVIVVATVLATWFAQASYSTARASQRLTGAEDTVADLTNQQRAYTELIEAQTASDLIGRQLGEVMAEDLPWSTLLEALQTAAPEGIVITSVFGTLLSSTDEPTSAAVEEEDPGGGEIVEDPVVVTEETVVGSLTIGAVGVDEDDCADYMDALESVPGLVNPTLTDATRQDGRVNMTVRLEVTRAALGGRFGTGDTDAGGDG